MDEFPVDLAKYARHAKYKSVIEKVTEALPESTTIKDACRSCGITYRQYFQARDYFMELKMLKKNDEEKQKKIEEKQKKKKEENIVLLDKAKGKCSFNDLFMYSVSKFIELFVRLKMCVT